MNPALLAKLQALLALAASKENQHEADLALAKAMEIATKNGIDIASVTEKESAESKEPFVNENVGKADKNIPHESYVKSLLIAHFKIKTVTGFHVSFIGKTSDVAFAKFLYFFLIEEFFRRWKTYYATHKVPNRYAMERKSFMYGVFCGLNRKLKEAKEQAEKDGLTEVAQQKHLDAGELKNKYSLMIVTEQEALENALGEYFPTLRKGRKFKQPSQQTAMMNGYKEGQKICIPGTPLPA